MADFSRPVGFLLKDYVALTPGQQTHVLRTQAEYIALWERDKDAVASTRITLLPEKLKEKAVEPARVEAIYKELEGNKLKQAMPREVPLYGIIAVDLGYVTAEQKNVILTAQAAEKTTPADGKYNLLNREGKLDLSDKMATRPFIGSERDPAYLTRAQSANHLVEILATARKLEPEIDISGGEKAGTAISAVLFSDAADRFGVIGMHKARADATEKSVAMLAQVNCPEPKLDVLKASYNLDVNILVNEAQKAIKTLAEKGKITEEEKTKLEEIISQRQKQVGTELPVDMRLQNNRQPSNNIEK